MWFIARFAGTEVARFGAAAEATLGGPGDSVTLFRGDEADAWLVLGVSFAALLLVDLCLFAARPERMGFMLACMSTLGWIMSAVAFNAYVYWRFGHAAAWQWASAYSLEWLLSFDNLFVFHSIFTAYKTPEHMRHRPLFIGIMGAVLMRLSFLSGAEYLMHTVWFMHLVFGLLLVVIGVRSVLDDDEDDERPHWIASKAAQYLPIVDWYDPSGAFFIKVRVGADGRPLAQPASSYGAVAMSATREAWRGTLLCVVLLCIEAADLIFAVDSVSAVVAQVNHLFLAYSAVVFAMLGLRSGYFIIDELATTFEMFKYGIAVMLVFIGLKLIFADYVTVRPEAVCAVLVFVLSASVGLSYALGKVNTPESSPREKDEVDKAALVA
jgi:tellurite resistance protein TerC